MPAETATPLRRLTRRPPFSRSKLSDAAVAVSWLGSTFSTTPTIQAECTATPTISGRMASFNFLFLLHNIGIDLWKLALEWRFWETGIGYVDTHWVRGIIGEVRNPRNGVESLFGRRKPDITNPVNHVDEGQFPKSWVLRLNRLVFL
jgi:hypothetical protein